MKQLRRAEKPSEGDFAECDCEVGQAGSVGEKLLFRQDGWITPKTSSTPGKRSHLTLAAGSYCSEMGKTGKFDCAPPAKNVLRFSPVKFPKEMAMRICKALLPVGLALLLTSCDGGTGNPLVPCLQPLFTEADVDFDPTLVGSWADEKGDVSFTFEKSGKTGYRLTVTEKEAERDVSGIFESHLVRLGGFQFLDFYPEPPEIGDCFYKFHLMRAHTIARVWVEREHVRLALFNSKWLNQRIDEKSVQIEYRKVGDSVILTASTLDLQDLAFRYANDEDAFPDPLALQRTKDAAEQE